MCEVLEISRNHRRQTLCLDVWGVFRVRSCSQDVVFPDIHMWIFQYWKWFPTLLVPSTSESSLGQHLGTYCWIERWIFSHLHSFLVRTCSMGYLGWRNGPNPERRKHSGVNMMSLFLTLPAHRCIEPSLHISEPSVITTPYTDGEMEAYGSKGDQA